MTFDKPARKVPKNYNNITGKISTSKAKNLLSFESKLERDFAYFFIFDKNITNILEQPVTIEFLHENKKRRYTPDFYLKTKQGKDLLIEIKYYRDLKKNLSKLKKKFIAARKYADKNNMEFKIFTELCPKIKNKDFLFNTHFLLNYSSYDYDMYKLIYSQYKNAKTINELLYNLSTDRYKQLEYINYIWTLVKEDIIIINLEKKITRNSIVLSIEDISENDFKKLYLDKEEL